MSSDTPMAYPGKEPSTHLAKPYAPPLKGRPEVISEAQRIKQQYAEPMRNVATDKPPKPAESAQFQEKY